MSTTGGLAVRMVRPMTLDERTDDGSAVTFCGLPAQTAMEFGFAAGESGMRGITTLRLSAGSR